LQGKISCFGRKVSNNAIRYVAPKVGVGKKSRQRAEDDKKRKQGKNEKIRHLRGDVNAIFLHALNPDLVERRPDPEPMRAGTKSVSRVSRVRRVVNRHL
jgi:hypothetical protein